MSGRISIRMYNSYHALGHTKIRKIKFVLVLFKFRATTVEILYFRIIWAFCFSRHHATLKPIRNCALISSLLQGRVEPRTLWKALFLDEPMRHIVCVRSDFFFSFYFYSHRATVKLCLI